MVANSVPVVINAGICIYVGLYYMIMYFRRVSERANLTFALSCLSAAFYNITCAGLYNADSIAQGIHWQVGNFTGIGLLSISLWWFVIDYTEHKKRGFGYTITIFNILCVLFLIFHTGDLTLSLDNPLPRTIHMGGYEFTYWEVEPGLIPSLELIGTLFAYSYLVYLLVRHYRLRKDHETLIIIVSVFFFFISVIVDMLNALGLISFVYIVEYSFMLVIVSMAYAMLNRFVNLHQEVEELNVGLEAKVTERTLALKDAHDALWGEMLLAKKIQTILLPEKPTLKGYDLITYMDPADEVGGDYYDIISVNDREWLAIGDVSGHGVPAGLIMMMVQTSVHLVLDQNPNCSPSELLSIINKTITKNIRKLKEDKYMSITVLSCHENGRFLFSGLHQDIIIYRAEKQDVEAIETKGMWLGVVDDLEDMTSTDELTLDVGDLMLLYTDGMIEASLKENPEKSNPFFGEDKLYQILRKFGDRDISFLKNRIMDELEKYQAKDDITFVMIKRKE